MAFTAFIPIIGKVLDSIFPDKEKASEAKLKVLQMQATGELAGLDAQMKIIVAEANSEHKLAAIWRPVIMLMFGFIIFNNYILYPYLSLFFERAPVLKIPIDLWQVIKIGLGGYVIGRSGEKIIDKWKK
jgi:hypothetical protein